MEDKVKKYFENPRKIIDVKPIANYTLLITFDNGEIKKYEMINELYGVFTALRDVKKFESVFIDEVGNVAWNIDENIDSSIYWQNHVLIPILSFMIRNIPNRNIIVNKKY